MTFEGHLTSMEMKLLWFLYYFLLVAFGNNYTSPPHPRGLPVTLSAMPQIP